MFSDSFDSPNWFLKLFIYFGVLKLEKLCSSRYLLFGIKLFLTLKVSFTSLFLFLCLDSIMGSLSSLITFSSKSGCNVDLLSWLVLLVVLNCSVFLVDSVYVLIKSSRFYS